MWYQLTIFHSASYISLFVFQFSEKLLNLVFFLKLIIIIKSVCSFFFFLLEVWRSDFQHWHVPTYVNKFPNILSFMPKRNDKKCILRNIKIFNHSLLILDRQWVQKKQLRGRNFTSYIYFFLASHATTFWARQVSFLLLVTR